MSSRFLRGPIERQEAQKIESCAWGCTIGAGNYAEEPDANGYASLAHDLGREPTQLDRDAFRAAWRRHNTDLQNP